MAKNPADRRLVYLALKNVFRGADAQLRKSRKIRELVQKHQHEHDLRVLIREHGVDHVCSVAKSLLEEQIFESTLRAKICFPEVFEVSPAQSAERVASEVEATKTEDTAIENAAGGVNLALIPSVESVEPTSSRPEDDQTASRSTKPQNRLGFSTHSKTPVPSLYPVYLPFETQHLLLVKVQNILEKACYEWGQKSIAATLRDRGWACPEMLELNKWPGIIICNQDKLATHILGDLGKPLKEVLNTVTQIRHTAVHRLRVTASRVEQFMLDSEFLVRLLQNDTYISVLSQLRYKVQSTIDELKSNKDLLESKLLGTLNKISVQRIELDRLERVATEDMAREDEEYRALAGAQLKEAVTVAETREVQSTINTDSGSESEEADETHNCVASNISQVD